MRPWAGIGLAIAVIAIAPQSAMTVSAAATSVVLEALPYLAVAAIAAPVVGRFARVLVAYAGCGCTAGPSARSIPAAIATAALFGLPVAAARVVVASLAARMTATKNHDAHVDVLGDVAALLPAALLAAVIMLVLPVLPLAALPVAVLRSRRESTVNTVVLWVHWIQVMLSEPELATTRSAAPESYARPRGSWPTVTRETSESLESERTLIAFEPSLETRTASKAGS